MGKFRKYFHETIQKEYPQRATHFITDIESVFKRIQPDVHFAKTSKNPVDRRMEIAAYFLATIEVLDKAGAPLKRFGRYYTTLHTNLCAPKMPYSVC